MANLVQRRGSRFVVDFGEVELPLEIAKDLDTEIQALALRTLARTSPKGPFSFGRLPIGIWGMIFSDWNPDWFSAAQHGEAPEISFEDHNIIVEAGMTHALALTRIFSADRRAGKEISEEALIGALARLPSLDERARRSSLNVLKHMQGRGGDVTLNAKTKQVLAGIERQIDACDGADDLDKLLSGLMSDKTNDQIEGLSTGLGTAIAILRSGRSSIYSPDNPFYEILGAGTQGTAIAREGNQDTKDVIKADAKGAVAGGVSGGVAGGPAGAVVGAIAGSAGKSLAKALSKVWDSIFG